MKIGDKVLVTAAHKVGWREISMAMFSSIKMSLIGMKLLGMGT